jgi:hypothetical protein
VYDHEKLNPAGFPCAFVTFAGSENEFFTTAENKRIYSYRILVLIQIGQDRNNSDRVELAEQTIQDLTGDIIDNMDSDITLSGNSQVVFVEAAVGEPGYYEYDYENSTYFKVFNEGEKWFYIEDDKIKNLDIDYYIKYYGNNAKCVISHKLFLDKKMKCIRNNKFIKSNIDEIIKNQS